MCLSDLDLNPARRREYAVADAAQQSTNPFARQLTTTPAETDSAELTDAQPTRRRRTEPPSPTPTAPAATLQPLTTSPRVGDTLAVPRALWPTHPCHELGGSGWTVTVTRCHRTAARVHFVAARTRDGRAYEDVLVPFEQLRAAA